MMVNQTLGVLLAGGVGERLYPLTRDRAKPAVPFGGIYRIIDVTLSNCINSGLRKIFIFTQYKALSLNHHIRHGWFSYFAHDLDEFIEIIPPQKRVGEDWYLGTADAVRQNLYSLNSVENVKYVLILSADHIYKMDYARMLEQHINSGADVTVGAIEIPLEEAHRFGVVVTDASGRITGFQEKPSHPRPSPSRPQCANVSMGIYVFNRKLLNDVLEEDARNPASSHDFGKDVLPSLIATHSVQAYMFVDENKKESQYWMDVGTVEAYYRANMDLVAVTPHFNLYDKDWPIRTYQRQYPPAKFVFAQEGKRMGIAVDSIVSSGCIVSGGRVVNSVLSPNVRVNSYCEVDRSILLSHVNIGRNSRIRNAIIDRDVQLPEHTVIGFDLEDDRRRFHVDESGIVVVVRDESNSYA
ncbi:MAG: glucose-1-phosphate adenylyltransferase [Acidobacteriota bacterium]